MVETRIGGVAVPGIALLGLGASRQQARRIRNVAADRALPALAAPEIDLGTAVRAARRLNRAAGTLAASVLADSAIEHYRGSFHNKAMFAPLVASALSLALSAHGVADKRPVAHRVRDVVYATTGLIGLIGTAFHIYNIRRKPGGFSWQNLFYSAPIGAPAALVLSGGVGFLAELCQHLARHRVYDRWSFGWPGGGRCDGRGYRRYRGRSWAAAFSWRLPQSIHAPTCHDPAGGSRLAG